MSKTSIEWSEFSVNPIRYRNNETGKVGHYCEKISAGCKNCYSSQIYRTRMPNCAVVQNEDAELRSWLVWKPGDLAAAKIQPVLDYWKASEPWTDIMHMREVHRGTLSDCARALISAYREREGNKS